MAMCVIAVVGVAPMLQAGWKPDHIAGPNFLDRPAFALNPAEA